MSHKQPQQSVGMLKKFRFKPGIYSAASACSCHESSVRTDSQGRKELFCEALLWERRVLLPQSSVALYCFRSVYRNIFHIFLQAALGDVKSFSFHEKKRCRGSRR